VDPQLASLARRLEELSAQVQELREGIRQSVAIAARDPESGLWGFPSLARRANTAEVG
jgi:hypothetical protein